MIYVPSYLIRIFFLCKCTYTVNAYLFDLKDTFNVSEIPLKKKDKNSIIHIIKLSCKYIIVIFLFNFQFIHIFSYC